MEKQIDFTQSYARITMNITGDCVRKRAKKCRTMSNKLKEELAILIGVDENTIEFIKPTNITNGFMLKVHVYVNDESKAKIDFAKILNEANDNGKLSGIIKEAWILDDDPEISSINSVIIESKQLRLNSVEMLEQQISVGSTSTVQTATDGKAVI